MSQRAVLGLGMVWLILLYAVAIGFMFGPKAVAAFVVFLLVMGLLSSIAGEVE